MIRYIKMVLIALFTGVTAPLPISSSANYAVMNSILDFSSDEKALGFYYSAFMVIFAVVIMIYMRSIYGKSIRSLFIRDKKKREEKNALGYKKIFVNILISMIPAVLLFIPVSKEKLITDYFDSFLNKSNLLLVGAASVISGLILVVSIWYTRQKYNETHRSSLRKNVVHFSIFQLPTYLIPGFSHVSVGTTGLLLTDVEQKVIIRESYLYLAPTMLIVNLVKVVRAILIGTVFDPILLAVGTVVFAVFSALIIHFVSRFNIRKLFTFFSILSVILGIFIVAASFIV